MREAVRMEGITKQYTGGKQAVSNLDLMLREGEVFGFLGPNGAGKTTTVKLLNGMLEPTEGSCEIMGICPAEHPEQVHAVSGVMTEHAQMYDHLTGMQNLIFYGKLFGMDAKQSGERAEELLGQLELREAAEQKLGTYSTGMRQRLSLARALLHRPRMLFLDEPTSGLDPESAQHVNQLIRTLAAEEGITVFLCTHQLRYAQEICTRYGLIAEGRLLMEGTLAELRQRVSPGLTLCIRADGLPGDLAAGRITAGGREPAAAEDRPAGTDPAGGPAPGRFELRLESEEEIPGLIRRVVEEGGRIYEVTPYLPTLEELYFKLTREGR